MAKGSLAIPRQPRRQARLVSEDWSTVPLDDLFQLGGLGLSLDRWDDDLFHPDYGASAGVLLEEESDVRPPR